jgi:PAS domain S-box-containing protein
MSAPSNARTKHDGDLEFLWEDDERFFYRGRRPDPDGTFRNVLIVMATAEPPTASCLDRFTHEYALRDELNDSWAIRPLELVREHGRTMLILDDSDSKPLEAVLDAPMTLDRFLPLAVAIAAALSQLHRRGLIHKDLKPRNIMVNRGGDAVRFTGFGIASRLPSKQEVPEPIETITGTLAYMAPEQTGRMNRSIESGSDLYALGVTFYRMLTGLLPFTAANPMEWVHCHVAKRAAPPAELVEGLPHVVSAIIMKLLAKSSEERYQTAAGLMSDLQHCLAAWTTQHRIDYVALGENDTSDRLRIPEKLYGREREIEALLASYDRVVKTGVPEMVLVSGYSGIGKSALVHHFHKALGPIGGRFAAGKFEQHRHDIPHATLAQAFQGLVRAVVGKSDADLASWREALREALNPLGQQMVALVPELRLIIGDQPELPEASPHDAKRRFQCLVRRFIGVFAHSGQPLTLFLDDLQWLDAETLDLLEDLLTCSDLRHLLLVGAYRNNEVDGQHPLMRKLDAIRNSGARVQEIKLIALCPDGVKQLTTDALLCEPARAASLAQLMHEKTGGNPFFLIQFLHALAEEELLAFDHDHAQWQWDLGRIHAKGYTDNVADLIVDKLIGLPDETRTVLLELACFGNSAEVATLSLVHGTSEQQVHASLRAAARLGLVRRLDRSYAFIHDRVHEAAYLLEPFEDKRAALHLRVGMALAEGLATDEASEKLYLAANQLNRGVTASSNDAKQQRIIAINLAASRRARKATAYHAAIGYLEVARGLLGDRAHPGCSSTAFATALLRAECEFLTGHLDVAESQLLVLSQSCPSVAASADVTRLRASLYTVRREPGRAVDICLAFLREVGIDWSTKPARGQVDEERHRLRNLADGLSDSELHALPPMSHSDHHATMAVLADLVTPASLTSRDLTDLVLLAAARLTLQHGICDVTPYPLVTLFGVLASTPSDAELGFRLSQFGAALAERQPQLPLSGRALLVFGLHVIPWLRPIRSGMPIIQRGLDRSLAAGDLAFVAYSYRGLVSLRLLSGDPLGHVQKHAEDGLTFVEASRIELIVEALTLQKDLARTLMGHDDQNSFDVPVAVEPHPGESTRPLNAFFYYAAQIQINVLARRHDVALGFIERAQTILWSARAHQEVTDYRFYAGLAHAAAYDASIPEQREQHVSSLREQHRKLTTWSVRIPANFAARQTLLAAELARIEDRDVEAQRLYEESIRLAREVGFVQIEAIAAERAALFYEGRGIQTVVLSYLTIARDCYLRWGAEAKVRQLETRYAHLRETATRLNPTGTIGASFELLDLGTVLKVSEAVSGEIVLEQLVDTVLRTAIEHAGAERGLLLLPKGSEFRIQAEATTSSGPIRIDLCDVSIVGAEIPESLLLYSARTQQSIILDDAATHGAFTDDAYVRSKNARSILSLPIVRQGRPVALLYLENNLASHVFTPARLAVLKFLASQAATSLDNARLYRELQERESKIRRLVEANIIGIHIFNREGDIVDANQAFLRSVGYDRKDLLAGQLRWPYMTPPEWRDRTMSAQAEMKTTGAVQPFEKEYFRKDGSRVPVLIGAAAFDEQRTQGVAFVLDLSERKRAEADACESARRYREVQLELAHANRVAAMGQLTASIAHEVNQPSTAVVASAQAALRWLEREPPELNAVRQSLARIVKNGNRASEVIGRIRALIKKAPPRKEQLAINAVIREVIDLTRAEATRNRVLVETAFSEGLPAIEADRVELQQVAVNLILNAIEAMSEPAQEVRELLVSTARTDCGNVSVAIADSGPGFPTESVEQLFKPFYTTKPTGLGLGLSICRSIIDAHGGRLWASDNKPRGAVFQFTVPAKATM